MQRAGQVGNVPLRSMVQGNVQCKSSQRTHLLFADLTHHSRHRSLCSLQQCVQTNSLQLMGVFIVYTVRREQGATNVDLLLAGDLGLLRAKSIAVSRH